MDDIRTDLAIEAHEMCTQSAETKAKNPGIAVKEHTEDGVFITEIEVTNTDGASAIGKPIGKYITIEAPDIKYSESVIVLSKAYCEHFVRSFWDFSRL